MSENETLKKRFIKAVGYLIGEGQIAVTSTSTSIARKMGLKNSNNMSAIFNGDQKYFTEGFIKRFCEAYTCVSPVWILSGQGSMTIESERTIFDHNIEIPQNIETLSPIELIDLSKQLMGLYQATIQHHRAMIDNEQKQYEEITSFINRI